MKLYGYYRSSASYRIRIILNLKGIAWENRPVMLNRDEQRAATFRTINPMRLVPVLDIGDAMLAQSAAIAEYLEETFPAPPLLPGEPLLRAQVRELQHLIGCDIHPLQNLRVLKHLRAEFGQDDAGVEEWCRKWIGAGFEAYEAIAAKRSASGLYSIGDSLSLADAWLVPQLYNARRFGLDLAPFPTIAAIGEHCLSLDPIAAAHPDRQPDAQMVTVGPNHSRA
ncbi:MAG TPA: maleylacetoacetate isomerase [Woeseiaceae bacterium]|nr:maleylacetoacetate isomerase [Woeseiaceae bacterium]